MDADRICSLRVSTLPGLIISASANLFVGGLSWTDKEEIARNRQIIEAELGVAVDPRQGHGD